MSESTSNKASSLEKYASCVSQINYR